MRNFIKCMACNIDPKKKKMLFQTDWVSDWTGKKKKNCVTNWGKKRIKELENRTMCVTNWGKGAQRT